MTLLKDLLALRDPQPVAEEKLDEVRRRGNDMDGPRGNDMDNLMDTWIDANKAYSWEGRRGVQNLTKLVHDLSSDYSDLDYFFTDNSGAIEAVLEWIRDRGGREWKDALEAKYGDQDEDGGDKD